MSTRKNNSKKFGGWYNDLPIAIPQQRTAKKGGAVSDDITDITRVINEITAIFNSKIRETSSSLTAENSQLTSELRTTQEKLAQVQSQLESLNDNNSTLLNEYSVLKDSVKRELEKMKTTFNGTTIP